MEPAPPQVRRTFERMVDDVVWGRLEAAIYGPRTVELDKECKRLEAELAAVEPPAVVTLHPGALADYERKLERLQAAIAQDIQDGDPSHAQAIRDPVEHVTVKHDATAPSGLSIEITGRLNALLGEKAYLTRVGGKGSSGGGI